MNLKQQRFENMSKSDQWFEFVLFALSNDESNSYQLEEYLLGCLSDDELQDAEIFCNADIEYKWMLPYIKNEKKDRENEAYI